MGQPDRLAGVAQKCKRAERGPSDGARQVGDLFLAEAGGAARGVIEGAGAALGAA